MNPQTYLADLRQRAAGGNPAYAYELGLVLLYGQAQNPPDPEEAALWLSRAKQGGISLSENVYEDLIGTGQRLLSADECRRWRRGMGSLPAESTVVAVQPEQVFAHCCKAAEIDATAAFLLADMYDRGYGCVADADQALYWYTRAMRGGNVEAAQRLVHYYQSSQRHREAEEAYRLLAKQGDLCAQLQLFLWYPPVKEEVVLPDKAEIFARCKAAAAQGDVQSQALLGLMLMHGEGCEVDSGAAAYWLCKASENGEPLACFALSEMLWDTQPQKAFDLLRHAAQCGILPAMRDLVRVYDHIDDRGAKVVECQPHLAVSWALRLVDENQADAMLYLAYRWISGSGLGPKKPVAAHSMLLRFVRTADDRQLRGLSAKLVLHVANCLLNANYCYGSAVWFSLLARHDIKGVTPEMGREAAHKLDETAQRPQAPGDLGAVGAHALYAELAQRFRQV